MSSANLWHSGFFLVSLLDTRESPSAASPPIVADLNSSSRMESRSSSGRETRVGRNSLFGALRSMPSPRIRSMVGDGTGTRKREWSRKGDALAKRDISRAIAHPLVP